MKIAKVKPTEQVVQELEGERNRENGGPKNHPYHWYVFQSNKWMMNILYFILVLIKINNWRKTRPTKTVTRIARTVTTLTTSNPANKIPSHEDQPFLLSYWWRFNCKDWNIHILQEKKVCIFTRISSHSPHNQDEVDAKPSREK